MATRLRRRGRRRADLPRHHRVLAATARRRTTWCAAPPSRCSSRSPSAAACARVDDVDRLLRAGADKVGVNTAAIARPELIARDRASGSARRCSCCRSTRGARPGQPSGFEVTTHGGRRGTGIDAVEWAARARRAGRGRDPAQLDGRRRHQGRLRPGDDRGGARRGRRAGDRQRRRRARWSTSRRRSTAGADAVLAASVFHFGELRIGEVKDALRSRRPRRPLIRAPRSASIGIRR